MGRRDREFEGASGSPARGYSAGLVGYLVGPVFLALALWFTLGPNMAPIPSARGRTFDRSILSTLPLRTILGDPPLIQVAGFDFQCMDCHRLFPAAQSTPDHLMQHSHIVLDHGMNDACRNCHHTTDRNRLALRGGGSIPYTEVVRLCAQCHGPTYRDWQRGAHGRTNDYWDVRRGDVRRLKCTECHDPHAPRYPAMNPVTPLPPPVTLRMGTVRKHSEALLEDERDPLRKVLYGSREPKAEIPEDE